MPLSKARNRERMREIRLHKQHRPPAESKPVQLKPIPYIPVPELDADGNIIPEV